MVHCSCGCMRVQALSSHYAIALSNHVSSPLLHFLGNGQTLWLRSNWLDFLSFRNELSRPSRRRGGVVAPIGSCLLSGPIGRCVHVPQPSVGYTLGGASTPTTILVQQCKKAYSNAAVKRVISPKEHV